MREAFLEQPILPSEGYKDEDALKLLKLYENWQKDIKSFSKEEKLKEYLHLERWSKIISEFLPQLSRHEYAIIVERINQLEPSKVLDFFLNLRALGVYLNWRENKYKRLPASLYALCAREDFIFSEARQASFLGDTNSELILKKAITHALWERVDENIAQEQPPSDQHPCRKLLISRLELEEEASDLKIKQTLFQRLIKGINWDNIKDEEIEQLAALDASQLLSEFPKEKEELQKRLIVIVAKIDPDALLNFISNGGIKAKNLISSLPQLAENGVQEILDIFEMVGYQNLPLSLLLQTFSKLSLEALFYYLLRSRKLLLLLKKEEELASLLYEKIKNKLETLPSLEQRIRMISGFEILEPLREKLRTLKLEYLSLYREKFLLDYQRLAEEYNQKIYDDTSKYTLATLHLEEALAEYWQKFELEPKETLSLYSLILLETLDRENLEEKTTEYLRRIYCNLLLENKNALDEYEKETTLILTLPKVSQKNFNFFGLLVSELAISQFSNTFLLVLKKNFKKLLSLFQYTLIQEWPFPYYLFNFNQFLADFLKEVRDSELDTQYFETLFSRELRGCSLEFLENLLSTCDEEKGQTKPQEKITRWLKSNLRTLETELISGNDFLAEGAGWLSLLERINHFFALKIYQKLKEQNPILKNFALTEIIFFAKINSFGRRDLLNSDSAENLEVLKKLGDLRKKCGEDNAEWLIFNSRLYSLKSLKAIPEDYWQLMIESLQNRDLLSLQILTLSLRKISTENYLPAYKLKKIIQETVNNLEIDSLRSKPSKMKDVNWLEMQEAIAPLLIKMFKKIQMAMTNMSPEEIEEALSLYKELCEGIEISELEIFSETLGWNLKIILDLKEKLLEIKESVDFVTEADLAFFDILASENLREIIEILYQNRHFLETCEPYWEIAARFATDILIREPGLYREFGNDPYFLELASLSREELFIRLREALKKALNPSEEEIKEANLRNFEIASSALSQGKNFLIPEGSLVHCTNSFLSILFSANLAGECLGIKKLSVDRYPGFVDLQEVGQLFVRRKISEFAKNERFYIENANYLIYYPHPELQTLDQPRNDIRIPGHKLIFGALPNKYLSLIIWNGESEDLTAIKNAEAETGQYIPIFNYDGELLFTPEEYQTLYQSLKKYQSLADFIQKRDCFPPDFSQLEDPGGEYTLAEHLIKAAEIAEELAKKEGLSKETTELLIAAALLHDVGKIDNASQEISNPLAAENYLREIAFLKPEDKRRILLLIKYDELFGEILKNVELSRDANSLEYSPFALEKINQLQRVFKDSELRKALLILYQADVQAKGANKWQEWQVAEKIRILKKEGVI